ncbi:DUF3014 domain-containing protein [Bowmanella yangjiangensis]|uniref:DUF3014 domain-containing protein n=1 Tax=Bowmanella yangjiangensis TaxID=2811230 RepID=A0ABS3CZA0_9ALTE|nr:DUF3014 domain-containing protein [Bowmanella yangjiangensis]MBN7821680.1 DUF3014 domain-containing protein [Bowmanella yangjiangensis]
MAETESTEKKSLLPHALIGGVLLIILLAVFFWPSEEPAPETQPQPLPAPLQVEEPEPLSEPQPEPEIEEPQSPAQLPEQEPAPEPLPAEPIDVSDGAVKTAILNTGSYEALARFIVDDDLLRRFVVFSTNLSNSELAASHRVLQPPQQEFRVYRQAGKEWIDTASYKRYTPYVEALESMDTNQLIALYEVYKPAITEIFAEVGDGSSDFDDVLDDAINHLLDTPEVPIPVEVSTDSVMYKYTDERLESLSAPQKQLLRTGPENMRLIKAKLREIRDALAQ